MTTTTRPAGPRWARRHTGVVLLLLPVLGLGWVPAYARDEPRLFDVPFFYWYQLAWIALVMACMAGAALLLGPPDRPSHQPSDRSPEHGGSL